MTLSIAASRTVWLVSLLVYSVLCTVQTPDEQKLLKKLFKDNNYDNSVRPVYNSSKNVEVTFGFTLTQIMDMDEKNQVLVTNVWLEMIWIDERISWKKEDYNGLEVVRLPAKLLWLPDIVLYNNADDYTSGFMPINAMVFNDGTIAWGPPVRFKSSCKVDITYFPFDHQISRSSSSKSCLFNDKSHDRIGQELNEKFQTMCTLKFGSWTYDKAQVDMLSKAPEVDVSSYVTNGEWMLTSYKIKRNEVVYPISPAVYPDVTVYLIIQRRVLYYILNILFPCFWLNILSVLTFCLPPDAGEKLTLSITVLLSFSVFMLLVADSMPPTSEFVPLIGIYLTVSLAVASVSVILTVLVLKLHHCSPHQKKIPRWVRTYVLGCSARVVRCNCVADACSIIIKRSRDKYSSDDTCSKDVQIKLIKEMESTTHRNGSNHIIETSSKHASSHHIRNSHATDITSSGRLNLDFRDISASNRSSVTDDDINLGFRRDHANATMDDILKCLKVLVVKSDAEDAENEIVDEWKQVALVVDRLFFWLFLFLTIIATVIILVVVPSFKYIEVDGI